jgi:hypothetical protein
MPADHWRIYSGFRRDLRQRECYCLPNLASVTPPWFHVEVARDMVAEDEELYVEKGDEKISPLSQLFAVV